MVVPGVGYNKNLIPLPMKGEMFLYINVSYNIKNIVYIDEDKKFMRIIYNLQKNWFDTLLTFQNLNNHRVNTIFPEDKKIIWTPWITEINVEKFSEITATFEEDEEIFNVVPNKNFISKENSLTNYQSAHLFEVSRH